MKNYNEVAESVFARSSAILEQKNQSRKALVRKASTLFSCLVVVLIVSAMPRIGILHFSPTSPSITPPYITVDVNTDETNPDISNNSNEKNPDISKENNEKNPDVSNQNNEKNPDIGNNDFPSSGDNALIEWNEKNVDSSLAEILKKANENDMIKIYMRSKIDHSYIYMGKTLSEYLNERDTLLKCSEKLAMLVKDGESLKYGEALYTTGTPTGEKWLKELYDKTITFYGKDIIDKYIVDGVFLKSTLSEDRELLQNNIENIEKEYEKACSAYVSYAISNAKEQLSLQNIQPTISSTGDYLIIDISVKTFENMQMSNISTWFFSTSRGVSSGDLNTENDDIQMPQDAVIKAKGNE